MVILVADPRPSRVPEAHILQARAEATQGAPLSLSDALTVQDDTIITVDPRESGASQRTVDDLLLRMHSLKVFRDAMQVTFTAVRLSFAHVLRLPASSHELDENVILAVGKLEAARLQVRACLEMRN